MSQSRVNLEGLVPQLTSVAVFGIDVSAQTIGGADGTVVRRPVGWMDLSETREEEEKEKGRVERKEKEAKGRGRKGKNED